ncbi:hypothetical protein FRC03_009384 [Tulasnella sp. 419]|nr:hypothetical protein FRC03_009384 [Tulasnella sp. 419]
MTTKFEDQPIIPTLPLRSGPSALQPLGNPEDPRALRASAPPFALQAQHPIILADGQGSLPLGGNISSLQPQHSSNSDPGLVDPCNLLITNLDFSLDTSALYNHFRPYGCIINARVMRTDTGASKGFGLVRFQTPDQATSAINAMNGATLEGRNIVVRLHKPKANLTTAPENPDPRTIARVSGTHAPNSTLVPEEVDDKPQLFELRIENLDPSVNTNDLYMFALGHGPIHSAKVSKTGEGTSRGSVLVKSFCQEDAITFLDTLNGSMLGEKRIVATMVQNGQSDLFEGEDLVYPIINLRNLKYKTPALVQTSSLLSDDGELSVEHHGPRTRLDAYLAAFEGSLDIPMQYQELSTLPSSFRKAVLIGELTNKLSSMTTDIVPSHGIDAIVKWLIELDLTQILEGIHDPNILTQHISSARAALNLRVTVPSNTLEESPRTPPPLLDDPPSELPVTKSDSDLFATPSSPPGSIASPEDPSRDVSERGRFISSVSSYIPDEAEVQRITDLLMTLPKGERAICLFNPGILTKKIADAREVLDLGAEFLVSAYDEHVEVIARYKDAMWKKETELQDLRTQLADVQRTLSESSQHVTVLRPVVNPWEREPLSLTAGTRGHNTVGQILLAVSEAKEMIWALRPYNRGREAALECLKEMIDEADQVKAQPPPSPRRRIISWLKAAFEILGSIVV